ncbi:MAG TPA: diguanylate cyclase [Thauera sp.]|nr:diguanylate cyclase [Thauera sp.]
MNQDGPRKLLPRTPLAKTAALFLCYWLAWKASALFEVQPHVSALYVSAGLTTAVGMIGGWRHLPAAFLAICVVRQFDMPGPLFEGIDWGGSLRQVLVYGGTGLLLRPRWLAMPSRLTLTDAVHFVLLAFASTSVSAVATLFIPPFNHLPSADLGAVFLSFWGGDFAGVLLCLPGIVLGWKRLHRRNTDHSRRGDGPSGLFDGIHSSSGLIGLAVGVSLLTLLLPQITHSVAKLGILVLFPVLLAGLTRGAHMGYLVAVLVCAIQILAGRMVSLPVEGVLDLQLVLAMSAATALLAGAAHDDKHFEWQHANFDLLTGLANRHRFQDQLKHELLRAARTQQPLALMYIDLDGFKAVNDHLGHHVGDALLQQVAGRLREGVRETDIVARLGGDEFAIILPDLKELAIIDRIGNKLLERLQQAFDLDANSAHISASIGVALWPRDGGASTELVHHADRAMYEAKRLGRNRLAHHSSIETAVSASPPKQAANV